MLIKYKGKTSELLKDISLELRIPTDLKKAEKILIVFFAQATKGLSMEKSIELISTLPSYIKPFCQFYKDTNETPADAGTNNRAVMNVLEKHISPENLSKIYACFSETIFQETFLMQKMNTRELVRK